ncbi:hypothetical protein B9Z55_003656 [Caenorhabditis nigoni]|uniref:Sdz-33 F-box domain-containing protein n=1 Tax=Caenorhabditis nigoni TaxID=1611254 RepID=A0A2G5VRS9_9PELO|nr:hypothetical protein B9Z55_003656 [Caenorhabditis nigoni]
MSSSSTISNRTRIPLLQFPQLVRDEVFEYWDIFEIYQFSTLSKVTKSISKNMKKTKTSMTLTPFGEYHQISLEAKEEERSYKSWSFSICPSPEVWNQLLNKKKKHYTQSYDYVYHPVIAKNSVESFGSLVEHIQDVFAQKIEQVDLFTCWMNREVDDEELKSYLNWFNGYEKLGKISKLRVISGSAFKEILENWKVDVGILDARPIDSEVCTVDFQVDHLITQDCVRWVDFNVLRRFDCVEARVDSRFSNQDMNLFLKDWKEGKSYNRVYCFDLGMCERAKWKKMLEGLDAELRDLRKVRRTFSFNDNRQVRQIWDFHGGFDIKRIDGKVATIGHRYFQTTYENRPPKPHMLEEYDRVLRVWNSEDNDDEEEIEDVIVVPEGATNEYYTEQRYIESEKSERRRGRYEFMMIVW